MSARLTVNKLASSLAKSEGKKHQASIGDVRELLGLLSDHIYLQIAKGHRADIFSVLFVNGEKRFKRSVKRMRKVRK